MPEFGSPVEKLGTFARVLLFDKAGAGLSDPVPKFRTLDERAAEIEAVMARAPAHAAEITRMEDQHRDIAEGVASVQDIVASWVTSADPGLAKQLIPAVEDLSAVVGEHLTDEELNIVPLINEHITSVEWQEAVTRAAEFLSMKNLWLGPVLGGYVLDAASGDKGRRLIANVPLPKRMLALLLARRACAIYRRKIYG